jgi:basic membrane protein A
MLRRILTRMAAAIGLAFLGFVPIVAESAPLRIGAVYLTPVAEPWVGRIHAALQRASAAPDIEYVWTDAVRPEDFAATVEGYARSGHKLIMGDSFGVESTVRRVASEFPSVSFVFGSEKGPVPPNFGVFDNWIHEPAYLSGMIAGRMTRSGTVALVAGKPIAEINRLANAFCAGAKETMRSVRCRIFYIRAFFDPAAAREAARAQIRARADVIFAERDGAIEAARERGALAISNLAIQSSEAPDTVITGPVWDMWPTVSRVIRLVREGAPVGRDFGEYSRMKAGGAYLAPYGRFESILPASVRAMVAERTAEILRGTFIVPVNDRTPAPK